MPNQQFTGTGWHSWNVPNNLKSLTVDVIGAGSGNNNGGRVTGTLLVNDNQVLQIFVGEHGHTTSTGVGGDGGSGGGAPGGNGHGGTGANSPRLGGDGGGGATSIRINTHDGTIKVVAGGAGGDSGDNGQGGAGGGDVGESGHAGNAGPNTIGNPTGGTQTQGGNGGTSSAGAQYNGNDAGGGRLDQAGRGGVANTGIACHGGGGGGGGWHAGGGGVASAPGYAPGTGGAGGSNYDGGLSAVTVNHQGDAAATGDGQVTLTWVTPDQKNSPPGPPGQVKLNGADTSGGTMYTRITGAPTVHATLNDPDKDDVRLYVEWCIDSKWANASHDQSPLVNNGKDAEVQLPNLKSNTHYYVRCWAIDQHGKRSATYTSFDFWTNTAAPPDSLHVNGGNSGVTISTNASATFSWNFNDPDAGDLQSGFDLQYWTAQTATQAQGPVILLTKQGVADNMNPVKGPPAKSTNQWVFDPGTFKGNTFYQWQVRTYDLGHARSDWSAVSGFFAQAESTPPILVSPVKDVAQDVSGNVTFTWQFRDPDRVPKPGSPGQTIPDYQTKADLQYRAVGTAQWVLVPGTATTPGGAHSWAIPEGSFAPHVHYEWQVRTYDSAGNPSDWSDSGTFWSIATPGALAGAPPVPDVWTAQETLGCGEYRVYIFQQGGQTVIGELTDISALSYGRARDEITACTITASVDGDPVCAEFAGRLRCWMHEVVVYRSGVRVWEGPITELTFTPTDVTIAAQDVMVYLYRRILRQGFTDAYRIVERATDGTVIESAGIMPVVERARLIIVNALAPYDPNVLPYLTAITGTDDANEARTVADWSMSAWEEVDDMAANAGLDYTTVGRRIILFDTHTVIGRLPALTDSDFSAPPVVSEYGMQLATLYAVTDGNGMVGSFEADNQSRPKGQPSFYPYGPVEVLSSSYSSSTTAPGDTMTPEAKKVHQQALNSQAASGMKGRWPTPLIVRVPDNSTLSPDTHLGFQQLVPGVWLPLRSSGTCRIVAQWQKLDSVSVTVDDTGETVTIVMSPAPGLGADPAQVDDGTGP
jgi:hypothetical protein